MKSTKFFLLYFPFAASVFLGAFLLFQVQPMIGKYILPWFGGSSFVWITSLLFFQTILLLGYAYSYLLTKLHVRMQIFLHACLLLISAAVLILLFFHLPTPIMPPIAWMLPDTFSPLVQVLGVLSVSIGLPFFVLSTTSTLLQKWFSYVWHEKSPYALYALSNLGSLLGIAIYPFVIEPFLPLRVQGLFWSLFFIFYILFFCFACWQTLRFILKQKKASLSKSSLATTSYTFSRKHISLWLFLPAVSSLLLSAVSYQLTQGVAPIPFLWLVPLGLYLVSFILCFTEKNFYFRSFYSQILLLLTFTISVYVVRQVNLFLFLDILLYSMFLFFSFMVIHGELYRIRPKASHLNLYYLIIALGSAIGSAVVAIIAPLFFKTFLFEFYLALFLVAIISLFVIFSYENSVLADFLGRFFKKRRAMLTFSAIFVSVFFVVVSGISYFEYKAAFVKSWRNFYGIQRVSVRGVGNDKVACLLNGKIIHGCQYVASAKSREAIMYYGPNTGFSLSMQSLRKLQKEKGSKGLRIGVTGLGTGAIAAFGKEGDFFRFYELNPDNVEIAQKYFTYLKDSRAQTSVVVGDGRIALEKDVDSSSFEKYDLLALDAFSDDGIPVHLLTKEAFEIYLRGLSEDGIIVVHISSSFVNLDPVLKQTAKHFGLEAKFLHSEPANDDYRYSEWVLLSRKKGLLPSEKIKKVTFTPIEKIPDVWMWTDDYSNLFQIVKYLPNK